MEKNKSVVDSRNLVMLAAVKKKSRLVGTCNVIFLSSEDGVIPHLNSSSQSPSLLLYCSIAVGVRRGLLKVGRSKSEWRDEGGAAWLERCEGFGESCVCSNTLRFEWLLLQ
jgi:hypothetical protein